MTLSIPFTFCHGSGNEFILIDEQHLPVSFPIAAFTQAMCDRSGKLGADGVLIAAASQTHDGQMKMYNVDGTEAEMCGNGLRCVARYFMEHQQKEHVSIETKIGFVPSDKLSELGPGVFTVSAMVGPANLNAPDVPVTFGMPQVVNEVIPELDPMARFTALCIPNPHLITFVDHIDERQLSQWGERVLELTHIFPEGINITMVQKQGPQQLYVQTYERGCGLTPACGTAISSSSYVSCLLDHCAHETPITLRSKGGISQCVISPEFENRVKLIGNATFVYEGQAQWSDNEELLAVSEKPSFSHEDTAYQNYLTSM